MVAGLNWVKIEGTICFVAIEKTSAEYLKSYVAWGRTGEKGVPQYLGRYSSLNEAIECLRGAAERAILEYFVIPVSNAMYHLEGMVED